MSQNEPNVEPTEAAKTIVSEGNEVRERVRRLVVDSVRARRVSGKQVRETLDEVTDGAIAGVKESVPDRPDSVLREVVDGLADGLSATANAMRLALQEARARGESFAKEDVDKAIEDVRSLEEMFTSTVSDLSSRAGTEISGQFKDLTQHAKNTLSHLRPAVESAVKEAARHPVQMARDSAVAGAKAVPRAAGTLLQAAAGLLGGAADLLTGEESKQE